MVDDPLAPAAAVVVLGGQVPFRALEAASVYQQKYAREVWLTQGAWTQEDAALLELGIDRTAEYVYSQRVLLRAGVPPEAIRVLPGRNSSTADEVRVIARQLEAGHGERVIIVTSKYHTRRVRAIWRRLMGDRPQVLVRYARGDPFQPGGWWRNTGDAMAISREWFGLLNALAGFPMSSDRQ